MRVQKTICVLGAWYLVCELLFLLCFIAYWNRVVVSVILYPMFVLLFQWIVMWVACLTVVVNCLVKQFAICLGVVVILLLNVMVLFSVVGGWIDHLWSSKECVCCACDPSVRLDAPSICFFCVSTCRKLSPHLRV